MNFRYLILLAYLLLPNSMEAQKIMEWSFINAEQADQLRSTIKNTTNDTLKMKASRSMGFYYQESRADSALYYHNLQIKVARQLDLKIWEAEGYSQRGYVLMLLGKFPDSFESFSKGMEIAKDPANEIKNWRPEVFSNAPNLHDSRLAVLAMIYNDLGNLYRTVGNKVLQKRAHLEAIRTAESISNSRILERGYSNLSQSYPPLSDLEFEALSKAVHYAEVSGYKKYSGTNYMKLAKYYDQKNEPDSTLKYLRSSIQTNLDENNMRGLAASNTYASTYFSNLKSPDSALKYAYNALRAAKQTTTSVEMRDAYKVLSESYASEEQLDSAYKYSALESNLNDQLKTEKIQQISEYQNVFFGEQLKLKELEGERRSFQTRIRLYILGVIIVVFVVLAIFLYRDNRIKQKAKSKVLNAFQQLKQTQTKLIQSEKMASFGELTAGIAHEIQNPLNFVTNFSEVSHELLDEMSDEMEKGHIAEAKEIATEIRQNLEKINSHGERANAIVKGMLQHSRVSTGIKELTDINKLANEYLRLAYHGLRAKDKTFFATLETDFDENVEKMVVIPQDMGRVMLNLISNAFYAVNEKNKKLQIGENEIPKTESLYEPTVKITTSKLKDGILISVSDNGNGIPKQVLDKIFQPFFTTKPSGQGTGLGLSMSYDIITKGHGGELKVQTKEGEGTTFFVQLPRDN